LGRPSGMRWSLTAEQDRQQDGRRSGGIRARRTRLRYYQPLASLSAQPREATLSARTTTLSHPDAERPKSIASPAIRKHRAVNLGTPPSEIKIHYTARGPLQSSDRSP